MLGFCEAGATVLAGGLLMVGGAYAWRATQGAAADTVVSGKRRP